MSAGTKLVTYIGAGRNRNLLVPNEKYPVPADNHVPRSLEIMRSRGTGTGRSSIPSRIVNTVTNAEGA
ncbi:MAG: hypothetical protein NTV68_14465 [Methanomicrobiales archaeon]|nr:hypothetical protein [Methanomicrobiales archaeon]